MTGSLTNGGDICQCQSVVYIQDIFVPSASNGCVQVHDGWSWAESNMLCLNLLPRRQPTWRKVCHARLITPRRGALLCKGGFTTRLCLSTVLHYLAE